MFELKKLNVHRIVATEEEKAKLIHDGFEEVIHDVIDDIETEIEKAKRGRPKSTSSDEK